MDQLGLASPLRMSSKDLQPDTPAADLDLEDRQHVFNGTTPVGVMKDVA